MKPGDLISTVSSHDLKLMDRYVGLIGVIVRPVDDHEYIVKTRCRWWVLLDGMVQPMPERNLRLVNDGTDDYDNIKENQ